MKIGAAIINENNRDILPTLFDSFDDAFAAYYGMHKSFQKHWRVVSWVWI